MSYPMTQYCGCCRALRRLLWAFAVTACVVTLTNAAHASTWTAANPGNLLLATNWDSGVPNAVDAVATFAVSPVNAGDYTLNGTMTLGTLNNSNPQYHSISGAGTLRFERSGVASALAHLQTDLNISASSVVLASATEFLVDVAGSIDSLISGSKPLTKTGDGTLFINNPNNSYTGPNSIAGGYLAGGSLANQGTNSSYGQGDFVISNLGVLYYSGPSVSTNRSITLNDSGGWIHVLAGNTLTHTGAISGFGTLRVYGGTHRLEGSYTYDSATEIYSTLALGGANKIPDGSQVLIDTAGKLTLNNFSDSIGSLAGAGSVDLGSGTLTIGLNNTSTVYSGSITGTGGLAKSGTGILQLTNDNSYSGGTVVNNGTLRVATTLGSGTGTAGVVVQPGATLDGAGVIGGNVVLNGNSKLAPGNLRGTLTVQGNLQLSSTATASLEIGGLTKGVTYDSLEVIGLATLGGTLQVTLADGFSPVAGQSFDILDLGTRSGVFTTIQIPQLIDLVWDASQLYQTGVLKVLAPLKSDFNLDSAVNEADLAIWRQNLGEAAATHAQGDANGDLRADGKDFLAWQREAGALIVTSPAGSAVPEPCSWILLLLPTCLRSSLRGQRPPLR